MNKFILNEEEKLRILNLHESANKRHYLSEQEDILKDEKIITNHDRTYDYKKSGEEYFYKLKNAADWTKASGKGLESIKTKVYKEGGSTNPTPNVGKSETAFPFTTKEEGDKFRAWMNKYYPKTSKSLQLDPTGLFNNSYMKKAWNTSLDKSVSTKFGVSTYGDLYNKQVLKGKETTEPQTNGKGVGKSAYIKDKGGVNVRMSAKVNNGGINNIQAPKALYRMFKGDADGKIGEVVSSHKSLEYGDKKTWYKIKLIPMPKPYSTKFQKYGFVREDAITLK
ncbi:hypothetical protein OAA60_00405 [Porticoccaceae bacterium]|nr:hypothetical protein [Porticoccaceae bacterium]